MLVLNMEDIDRLQAITDALVEAGCGFAAVFAHYDNEPRRHASSGDTSWFTATNADPIRAAFSSLSVMSRRSRIGITALLPNSDRHAACEAKLRESLEPAAEIIEHAIYLEECDQRERERARNRLDRRGRGRERR